MSRVIIGPLVRPEPIPVAEYHVQTTTHAPAGVALSVYHGNRFERDQLHHCSTVTMNPNEARSLGAALIANAEAAERGGS